MKTIRLEDIRNRNNERRDAAIRAVRKVNPDFKPEDRAFDRSRKNKDKQNCWMKCGLRKMKYNENNLTYKTTRAARESCFLFPV